MTKDSEGIENLSKRVKLRPPTRILPYIERTQTNQEKMPNSLKNRCINTKCDADLTLEMAHDKTGSDCDISCANVDFLADARLEDQACGGHKMIKTSSSEPKGEPDVQGADRHVHCKAAVGTEYCIATNRDCPIPCDECVPKITSATPALTSLCDICCDKVPGVNRAKHSFSVGSDVPICQSTLRVTKNKRDASSGKVGVTNGEVTVNRVEKGKQEAEEDGADDKLAEPAHDVQVAFAAGPVSAVGLASNDHLSPPQDQNDRHSQSTLDDLSVSDISFEQLDDYLDTDLFDIDMLPSDQEMSPLYAVGSYVTSRCEICLEHKSLHLRLCCGTSVCDVCMTTYLESVIQTGKVKIQCPCNCQKYIHRDEIIGRLSLEMKAKYCKFLVDANNEAHIKTCPQCSCIVSVEPAKICNPKIKKRGFQVTCPECQLQWCFPCQAPWHEGVTCSDHRTGNKLLRKWAKEHFMGQLNAQKCPQCKVLIQRIAGCDHMTCSECFTSFCYRCGQRYLHLRYIGDHYSPFSVLGCKYKYLPDRPFQRRLVRGSILGAKLLAAPVLGAVALGIVPVVLSAILLFALPSLGVLRLYRYQEAVRRRRIDKKDNLRWEKRRADMHAAGDPYMAQYNRFQQLGSNPSKLFTSPLSRGSSDEGDVNFVQNGDCMSRR